MSFCIVHLSYCNPSALSWSSWGAAAGLSSFAPTFNPWLLASLMMGSSTFLDYWPTLRSPSCRESAKLSIFVFVLTVALASSYTTWWFCIVRKALVATSTSLVAILSKFNSSIIWYAFLFRWSSWLWSIFGPMVCTRVLDTRPATSTSGLGLVHRPVGERLPSWPEDGPLPAP